MGSMRTRKLVSKIDLHGSIKSKIPEFDCWAMSYAILDGNFSEFTLDGLLLLVNRSFSGIELGLLDCFVATDFDFSVINEFLFQNIGSGFCEFKNHRIEFWIVSGTWWSSGGTDSRSEE